MRLFSLMLSSALALALPSAASALTMKPGTAWPNRTIPVCWDDPRKEHRQERDLIRKAVSWTWERESALSFTGWRKCQEGDRGIRISLENSYPRTRGRGSEIDGIAGGVVLPSLWSLAALSVNLKAPVHEFGHALGFGHEYARRDVSDPELCGGKDRDGKPYFEDDLALTPFDPHSIMVGCIARATRDFSLGVPELSPIDIFGLVQTYGSHPDNVLDSDETGDLFGAALVATDLDGDDIVDLAVGAPGEDHDRGAVYLYRGTERRGFRPWRKVTIHDVRPSSGMRRFGTALEAVVAPDANTPATLFVRADAATGPSAVQVTINGDNVSGERAEHAGVPTRPEASKIAATVAIRSGAYSFPDLLGKDGRGLVHLSLDLNQDGIEDHIVGAPHADGDAVGSGAVIILRGQTNKEAASAWYWFGQAY